MRYGYSDPTTRLTQHQFVRATLTPEGPGTVHLRWGSSTDLQPVVHTYGPGGDWLAEMVPAMCGQLDEPVPLVDAHPVLMAAQERHGVPVIGASGSPYHDVLPIILGQRITAGEAVRQWAALVRRLGEPAPGPFDGLRLPPAPQRLAALPSWWFHPLGIEAKRANALKAAASHGSRLIDLAHHSVTEAGRVLRLIPGVGAWSVGSVLGVSHGDPDAIAVGDYHLKNLVVHALTGAPRGTDEQMLQLLAPYAGQRGRAVRLLQLDGHRPPSFGPRQRILPMSRW
ncbi:MAG TPA: DNA-3-methyladenine glycosylase [Acidimicrobiaceae bacterium]|nr:DNA-3-methyladenine glycosylase [Acidimicrobiaceae bacterium]